MKRINIEKGIPIEDFKKLLQIGEPFELDGTQILVFDKDKISRISKEKLLSKQENDRMSVEDLNSIMKRNENFDFEQLKEVNGVEVTKYDKQMLAAGNTVTIGTSKVSIRDGKLTIALPLPKRNTPKFRK